VRTRAFWNRSVRRVGERVDRRRFGPLAHALCEVNPKMRDAGPHAWSSQRVIRVRWVRQTRKLSDPRVTESKPGDQRGDLLG
jgi:hypothetical protein